jgi:hypothetical protein
MDQLSHFHHLILQASELRYNELVTQVPESTRPLLRQIEAMQVLVFLFGFSQTYFMFSLLFIILGVFVALLPPPPPY